MLVREKPPLRLMGNIVTPAGRQYRLGDRIRDSRDALQGLVFSTVAPGGFESCSFELLRDVRRQFADLDPLATVQIRGAGGRAIAGEFRLEQIPNQSGFDSRMSPQLVGWQTHLDDDESAVFVGIDQDLSQWIDPPLSRQIDMLQHAGTSGDPILQQGAVSLAPDSSGDNTLVTEYDDTWAAGYEPIVEQWYDSNGLVAKIYYHIAFDSAVDGVAHPNWEARLLVSADEHLTTSHVSGDLNVGGIVSGYYSPADAYRWATVRQNYTGTAGGGTSGQKYQMRWRLAVYGKHNLPLSGASDPQGLLASDVAGYVIDQWCPALDYTTGIAGTIQPSTFVIPQLSFLTPSKPSDILNQAFSFELLDWFVWENKMFYLCQRPRFQGPNLLSGGTFKTRLWQAYSGPSQLNNTGKSVTRVYNGVVVTFTGTDGRDWAVGPPGTGLPHTDSSLQDPDPQNPANQLGINRYATVSMQGTSTIPAAITVGSRFLQEQKLLDRSGEASLIGWVQDSNGVWEPAWKVRAGDYIRFVDASDKSYRRIVHTEYDDTSKTNSLQLDQPPDALAALLQRLSIVLVRLGIT